MTLKKLIEQIVEQEIQEVNAIVAGGVSATGGSPLGQDMDPAHKTMWSGDIKEAIEEMLENVLDDMGLKKATGSVRKDMVGGGEVYMDRHDSDKKGTKAVMAKVSKNLNKTPYSKDPPRMGLPNDR